MQWRLVTPHAAILIWNYTDRRSSSALPTNAVHDIEQVVIGTSSVISISTSRSKSAPSGSFEIKLAPRFNWVTRITPGSWCAILMSQDPIPTMAKGDIGTAKQNSFKMLGRIDSVRGVVDVNQETGARNTYFVVTGKDWGSVFETLLYLDAAVAENVLSGNSIAQAYSLLGMNMYATFNDEKALPTPSDLVDFMINLWGVGPGGTAIVNGEKSIVEAGKPISTQLLLSAKTQFRLPKLVAQYMSQGETILGTPVGPVSVNFAEIIHREHGKLGGFDDPEKSGFHYKRVVDSTGLPNPSQLMGQHSLWQIMTDVSNTALYELVNDIRWDGDKPTFMLYHRIRPFMTRDPKSWIPQTAVQEPAITVSESAINELASLFKNVRRIKIPLNDVVSLNFGTNWRDQINFIEVRATAQLIAEAQGLAAKINGQTLDTYGYQRDGFKPLIVQCPFVPQNADGSGTDVFKLTHWKYILREWYFNTHMMLNGSVTLIGQNKYIQVGDNIAIPSAVLGQALTTVGQLTAVGQETYLLAHVEGVAHNFSVNQETGARTFSTTIQFVRGIIADSSGNTVAFGFPKLAKEPGAIDENAGVVPGLKERNMNTFGTSTDADPDADKIKGS